MKTSIAHLDRTAALEEMFEGFRVGRTTLPGDARRLGGRMRDGYGEFYRQLVALTRTLQQDASGNWTSRFIDNSKADHFAHAETYCLLAAHGGPGGRVLRVRAV